MQSKFSLPFVSSNIKLQILINLEMKQTDRKDRRLLNELIIQHSQKESHKSNINLPNINKRITSSNHRGSTNSVDSHLKQKKRLKDEKWKAKQLYIDDYTPYSNRRVQTENKKLDQPVESSKKKVFFTGLNSDSSDGEDNLLKINKQKIKEFDQYYKKKQVQAHQIKDQWAKKSQGRGYFKQEVQQKHQIYNYFFRDFVFRKQQELSQDILDRYVANSSPENLRSIEQKGRQFLLDKMQSDYKNYANVEDHKKSYIRSLILQQIKSKKASFSNEFKTRNSSPYFSFLTLNKGKQRRSFV